MTVLTLGGGGMAEAFSGVVVPHWTCDVREGADVWSALDLYKPTAVILTAGVSNPDRIAEARFSDEITTNLGGAFTVAQECVRFGVDTLIFIASVAGLYGKPNHAAYCATKAGVISLVQSLAMEGHNAYAISPGRVDTPMREKDYPNDTPGSRLEPARVWEVVERILAGRYRPGDNVMVRKVGLTDVVEEVVPVPWRDELRVGQPVTI